jgi:N-acetylmuramoyl-L-alanine amidase
MKLRTICLTVLVLGIIAAATLLALPASRATGRMDGVKVCLDPGHGGADPGAVNEAFGLYESQINLDVAFALQELLQTSGADVVMTRTDDRYLDNRDRYTFCNGEQTTILISVHTNSSTNTEMDGALGLYFHGDDKILARAVYDVMLETLGGDAAPPEVTFTAFGLTKYASGVLLKSNMPATIAEPLFMSNPYEAAWLQQPIYGEAGCEDLSCRRGQIA